MKTLQLLLLLCSMACSCLADVTVSGYVRSLYTRQGLPDAEVRVPGTGLNVITNEDGFFSLKADTLPVQLIVSALGHRNHVVPRADLQASPSSVSVWLVPDARILSDVTVLAPDEIVREAIAGIERNYAQQAECLACFYRETTRKQSRYVNLSEAVMSLYKDSYAHSMHRDQVRLVKGRSLISQRARDTLAVQVMGGPHDAVLLDLVKNREVLLYPDDLPAYRFTMEPGTTIDERAQYVIRFEPTQSRSYALYRGTLYIDMELLAFTRMEISLDMSDRQKATDAMLVRKPMGLRFRPRELTTVVSYHYDGQAFRLSYLRNTFHFSCDWRKRWFSTTYRVVSEMVVTDHQPTEMPRSRKGAFSHFDVLDTQADNFNDPAYWQSYNILEPSESLEHAVQRLRKRAQ